MEYMQNQMDNLITASEYQYDAFCDKVDESISDYIKENGYTWTVEDIYKEYREKYCKGYYISYTAKKIIEKFKDDLVKVTGISKSE